MTVVVVNQGEEQMLDLILAVNYTLRLYKTDVTAGLTQAQVDALDETDFTEAAFAGYSAAALTGGSWVTTQDTPSTGTYAQQTFTRSTTGTAETIYGYYITRTSDGALVWFEDFTGPIVVTNAGDAIAVTPTIALDDDQEATVAAQGVIAQHKLTSNSAAYSADSLTDMALTNVPVVGGRIYAIEFHSRLTLSGLGSWAIECNINGVKVDEFGWIVGDTIQNTLTGRVLWEPTVTASTDDITVTANELGGTATLTLTAAGAVPRYLALIDLGVAP